jgi:DNA-binding NarL/FixJ family response regulator
MPQRVLIIDDNAAFRSAARALLEAGDFVVVAEAATGAEGILEADDKEVDVVIIDVQLPDLDGFEVAAQLHQSTTCQLILTSSRASRDFGGLVETSPVLGFIPKVELSARAIESMLAALR